MLASSHFGDANRVNKGRAAGCDENGQRVFRAHGRTIGERARFVLGCETASDSRHFGCIVQLERQRNRREPANSVVLSHGEAKLRARREQPIGLIDPARDKIVHQHADVRRLATQHER